MLRGLFGLIARLVSLALVAFVLTGLYVVYDGLTDKGDTADCAVVLGHAVKNDGQPGTILRERLDGALDVYRAKKVPLIIVSGGRQGDSSDEATGMANYLEAHNVPASAIVEDHSGDHTGDTARNVATIMRARHLHSVMVISHYYHITRTKLALGHEGIRQISQSHVGTVNRDDAFTIVREVGALWYYIFQDYLRPAAATAAVQAQAEAQVLKGQIQDESTKLKDDGEKELKKANEKK